MTSLVGHDGAISNSNSNSRNKRNANDGSTSAEWRIGLEFLAEKISKLTPFSAHGIARQSLLFHDDDERRLLPLIVCVQCLERIPPSPVQRWKRWQSIVCETIVLFQDRIGLEMERIVDNEEANNDESDDDPLDVPDAVVLWVEGVLQKLDLSFLIADNNRHQSCHLGVWAGLVGTTLRMVETFPQHTELLLEGLKRRNDGNLAPMELILLHPWRQHSSGSVVKKHSGSYQDTDEANGDENDNDNDDDTIEDGLHPELQRHLQSMLWWWTCKANCHDSVANMETAWPDNGVAMAALYSWNCRACTYSHSYQWNTWFPHLKTLLALSPSSGRPDIIHDALQMLSELLVCQTTGSHVESTGVLGPLPVIQALYGILVLKSRSSPGAIAALSGLIRQLMGTYSPETQIRLVEQLVEHSHDYPALIPRYIDTLRPLVLAKDCPDVLWEFLQQRYFLPLAKMVHENKKTQQQEQEQEQKQERPHDSSPRDMNSKDAQSFVDKLLDQVEALTAAFTLIRVRIMVHFEVPPLLSLDHVPDLLEMLSGVLDNDDSSSSIKALFPLDLFRNVLQCLIDLLPNHNPKQPETGG